MRKPTLEMYTMGADSIGLEPPSACSSTTCRSTSSRRRSWAWRPCTTSAPDETIAELERLLGVELPA